MAEISKYGPTSGWSVSLGQHQEQEQFGAECRPMIGRLLGGKGGSLLVAESAISLAFVKQNLPKDPFALASLDDG